MTLPYQPLCLDCAEDGTDTLATEERHGEPYCRDCAQSRDERAYEAMLDSYYGGSGDSDGSITAFCARALADKQGSR